MPKYDNVSLEELKIELKTRKMENQKKEILPTKEDIAKRKEIYNKALEIGVNLRMTDDIGQDNYYRDLALLYIMKGEDVPEDLKLKIEEEDTKIKDKKEKEFELQGCVTVPLELTEDEFLDKFIAFIEENGWFFGGGIKTI